MQRIVVIEYLKKVFGISKKLPTKIEIEYDGAKAICKVNGKYFNECDSFTKATVLSAFSCIEQHFKRTAEKFIKDYIESTYDK